MKASAAAAAALVVVALGVGKGAAADQAAAGADSLQPGQWEMVAQVTSMEIPSASPEAQAQIRSEIGQPRTNQECITPERARNPLQQVREMMAQGEAASCRLTDEVFGGGVIRIRATCPGAAGQGPVGQVSVEGNFTATTLQMTLAVDARGANPVMPGAIGMRMTAEIRGRRVGECPVPAPVPTPPPIAPAPPPRR